LNGVLPCAVLLPSVAAVVVWLLAAQARSIATGAAAASTFAALLLLITTTRTGTLALSLAWVPTLGLSLDLHAAVIGALFALALSALTLGIVLTAPASAPRSPAFYSAALAFLACAEAVVLADNLLLLVACAQLSALALYLLARLGSAPDDPAIALGIRMAGSLALLVGALILGDSTGSYSRDAVVATVSALAQQPLQSVTALLLLAGAALQAASWPRAPRRDGASPRRGPAQLAALGGVLLATGIAVRLQPVTAQTVAPAVFVAALAALVVLVAVARRATEADRGIEPRG
jgi:NADH:ubiquinone oxidoreductase subunit 5 (subunit L)/multisubunit Na+/H+ antiporter MnhA subunit